MTRLWTKAAFAAAALGAAALATPALAAGMNVPVEYHKLDNGLRVVLSPDSTVPTTTIGVYYGIGFRIEPKDRTGFAHLFEHMMFQGSKNLGKAEFIALVNQNGGVLNGSTRFDFTNYFQIVPSNKTETFIWAEADRMRSLDITQENLTNQQGVVKNEVKVNVLNQPYGGFPWLDLPQLANTNWFNAHNFYGDLADLDAATLDDVKKFFKDYYVPNNAVLVVAGDINTKETLAWAKKYFGDIPASASIPKPDISEPKQTEEKRLEKIDRLAPQPAIGWAYHVPERDTPEWYAMVMLDYILLKGEDSRLNQKMVQEKGYGSFVTGGINWPLGNIWNYDGPMLWSGYMIHGGNFAPDAIIGDLSAAVQDLQTNLVGAEELARAKIKLKSDLYDALGDGNRFGLIDTLASFALFHDNPQRINGIEKEFDVVTPELIRQVARDYLRSTNRSIITLKPGATPPAPAAAKGK